MKFIGKHPDNATGSPLEHLVATERPNLLQYACYRLGNPEDAEDTVQDLFLQLHERTAHCQPKRGLPFVYRCLRNLCIDRLRRSPLPTVPVEQLKEMCEEPAPDLEQEIRRIQGLLDTIPDEQAEVIRLRFYGNKSFAEISECLGLPLPTVKSRFRYGMEKIRKEVFRPLSL